jgi:hypothetical protein
LSNSKIKQHATSMERNMQVSGACAGPCSTVAACGSGTCGAGDGQIATIGQPTGVASNDQRCNHHHLGLNRPMLPLAFHLVLYLPFLFLLLLLLLLCLCLL